MKDIGLIIALAREIPAGFVPVTVPATQGSPTFVVYQWTMPACQIVAVRTGVGGARAAAGARFLVRHFAPQALISFGFAGGLLPGLAQGTVVIGEQLVAEDAQGPLLEANRGLVEQFHTAATSASLPVRRGAVVTSRSIVPDSPSKVALAQRSGACAVDMETRGVVEVAREASMAWVAVRAITDTAMEALPAACLAALRPDGRLVPQRLLREMWRSPGLIRNLFWLAKRTGTARRHLSQVLERWAVNMQLQTARERS